MTREEAIENLKEFIDIYITCHGEEDTVAVSLDNVDVEALDMAIETMRKYQKIEEIWDRWHIDISVKTDVAMSKIGEVLKDDRN